MNPKPLRGPGGVSILGDGEHSMVPHGKAGAVPGAGPGCAGGPPVPCLAAVALAPEVRLDVRQPDHDVLEAGPAAPTPAQRCWPASAELPRGVVQGGRVATFAEP